MIKPLVSVAIVTYNHLPYISKTIESVLMQRNVSLELVIGEDCSTDGTHEIVMDYANRHPSVIRVITSEHNVGSKQNGFRTIDACKGKYIAFCDGDDYWIDNFKLQKQIEIMENDPSISLCFTATKWVYVDGSNREKIMRYYPSNHYLSEKEVIMKGGGVTDIVSSIIRRDIYLNLPDWYLLSPVGDAALYLLSINHGRIFYLNQVTAVYHRGVKESWTQKNYKNTDHQIIYLKKLIRMKDEFDKHTDYRFHHFIKKRNNLDIIDLSFITKDYSEFKQIYFPRLTFFEKIEYYFFKFMRSRLFWHRYHKLLKLLGGN